MYYYDTVVVESRAELDLRVFFKVKPIRGTQCVFTFHHAREEEKSRRAAAAKPLFRLKSIPPSSYHQSINFQKGIIEEEETVMLMLETCA